MTTSRRSVVTCLMAVGLALLPLSRAAQISGAISFGGDYRPVDGGGAVVTDLTIADKLIFAPNPSYPGLGPTIVVQRNGDFSSVPIASIVTMTPSIEINPAVPPVGALWSVGGFSLTINSLDQTNVSADTLTANGTGTLSGNGFDPTPGTFIATFNTLGGTFSWSSSSEAAPCTGSIGDFVWQDNNANGCQEPGEPGIPNVQVDLFLGCGPNALFVTNTLTGADGKYLFTGLCAGIYTVGFHTPAGYTRTLANSTCSNPGDQPSDELDSDCSCLSGAACGICVTLLTDSSHNLTIDCGYIPNPLTLECPASSGQVGVPYVSTLVATGGTPPYTFSIIGGSLPPGLTLNPNTGAITGTPTDAGNFPFTAKVVDSTGGTALTKTVDCSITIVGVGGCRVTGGSNKQLNSFQSDCITTPLPNFVSHGGQVGAPFSVGTPFQPNSPCISGEWEHNRHLKQNSLVGVLHASGNGRVHQFDSLLCACLPCDENPNAVGVVGSVCNPGDKVCGPLPRRAPANKICFSGVGDYTFTAGNKTVKAVFRVDIEDRSEGNSQASTPPPDRYRIRIWLLDPSCGRNPDPNSAQAMAIRFAASADPATISTLSTTEQLKVNIAPDIDDGGDMTQGNHQIHPATGAVCQ